jgi:hypothetical protein
MEQSETDTLIETRPDTQDSEEARDIHKEATEPHGSDVLVTTVSCTEQSETVLGTERHTNTPNSKEVKVTHSRESTEAQDSHSDVETVKCAPKRRKYGHIKTIMGYRPQYLSGSERRGKYKRNVNYSESRIKQFYSRADNSVNLPIKRKVYKRSGLSRSILHSTTKELHKRYMEESSEKVSLRKFQKLRPYHINIRKIAPLIQCVCIREENVSLKLESLRMPAGKPLCLESVLEWNASSMCDKVTVLGRRFHMPDCVSRNCASCGLSKPKDLLNVVLKEKLDEEVAWCEWTKKKVAIKGKSKLSDRILKERKETTIQVLLDKLIKDSKSLSSHLHTAYWQQMMYDHKRKQPKEGEVVVLSDPSENKRNEHQCQPSSVHWSYSQCSVCPVVLHHICPEENCNEIVKGSVIAISDDLKHDHFFADKCETTAVCLAQELAGVKFKRITKFSDGAPTTYKSCYSIYLASRDERVSRHFFGSNHGKNLADGEGAVAKQMLDIAVRTKNAFIDCGADAVGYLQSQIPACKNVHDTHTYRLAVLVEVDRPKLPPIKPIKGIQKQHEVIPDRTGSVLTRVLSCFCNACEDGRADACENISYVGKYKKHVLKDDKKDCSEANIPNCKDSTKKSSIKTDSSKDKKKETKSSKDKKKKETNSSKDKKKEKSSKKKGAKSGGGNTTSNSIGTESVTEVIIDGIPYTTERRNYFQNVQRRLLKSATFSDFNSTCEEIKPHLEKYPFPQATSSNAKEEKLDLLSCDLLPKDAPVGLLPRVTKADGNCLFHAASQLTWGCDKYDVEMRVRACIEMALNIDLYTDDEFLRKGLPNTTSETMHVSQYYAQFMEHYKGEKLGKEEVKHLFR